MATYTGTIGLDTFAGLDSEADTFRFTAATLAGTDTASGGAGGFTDILLFTAAGTYTAAQLAGISGVERIALASGTNGLTLTALLAASAEGALEIRGNSGNDSVDGTAVTDPLRGLRFLTGTGGNDVFTGGAGNDTVVIQGSGDVTLSLGNGNDRVEASIDVLTGADALNGGAGIDRLVLTTFDTLSASALVGLSGFEEIAFASGGLSRLTLDATVLAAANNTLTIIGNGSIGEVDATATSGAQSVIYLAGSGADNFVGGAGRDVYEIAGAATGNLGAGRDTLRLTNVATVAAAVEGGSGIDTIEITAKGVWDLSGLTGFEEVTLATGATVRMSATVGQRLEGSVKADIITVSAAGQTVLADEGNDTVTVSAAFISGAVLSGGVQTTRDTLILQGTGNYNLLSDALVTGFERIVLASDGAGSTITLGNVAAEVVLRAAATVAMGSNVGQSVVGSRDADTITVGAAGQFVDGNAGDDLIAVTTGQLIGGAQLTGGTGNDQLRLSGGGTIDLQTVTAVGFEQLQLQAATTLLTSAVSPIAVLGSANADDITLRGAGQSANAGDGDDTLRTLAVGTTLNGGNGDDTFIIASGDQAIWSSGGNTLIGGGSFALDVVQIGTGVQTPLNIDFTLHNVTGIDRALIFGEGSGAAVTLTIGDALVSTADGNNGGVAGDFNIDPLGNVQQNVTVNAGSLTGNNAIRFNAVNSDFFAGNDTVTGGGGADLIYGGNGNDTLNGGANNDFIDGGNGNDTLSGGAGIDTMRGGAGNDSISAGDGADDITGGSGGDTITLTEAVAAQDTIRFTSNTDGSFDINTVVAETTADRVSGFDPLTDRIVLERSGLGLGNGSVVSVAANGAWNISSAAVFIFESNSGNADTLGGDNFGDLLNGPAFAIADNASGTGSSAGRTVALVISNLETLPVRRTGIYVWTDTDGDNLLEASDVVQLLGVFDNVTANQLTAANVLIG